MCAHCGKPLSASKRLDAKYCDARCCAHRTERHCLHCGAVCLGHFCTGVTCLKRFQRNFLRGYRAFGCFLCDSQEGIHLHHVRPSEKTDNLAVMCGHYSLLRLVRELEKCLPLCEKHHSETHKHYQGAPHGIITATFSSREVLVQMLLTEPVKVGGYKRMKKAA